jgi:hypothetical protein
MGRRLCGPKNIQQRRHRLVRQYLCLLGSRQGSLLDWWKMIDVRVSVNGHLERDRRTIRPRLEIWIPPSALL